MSNHLPLGECCNHILDFRGRTPLKLGMDWGGGNIPALSANNVRDGYIDFERECNVGSDALYEAWMTRGDCRKGDIIFTMEAPMGNVAQVPDNAKYILSQRVILLSPNSKIVHEGYLFHFMRSDKFKHQCESLATGTTAKGIKQANLVGLEIALPPLPEQKKIAEILSGIDKVIHNLKNCLGKQEILKNSLLGELIFHADASLGRPSKTNHFCLGDISTRITDGTHQAVKTSTHGNIPFLYVSCVKNGIIDWSKSALITEEQYAIATQGRQPSPGDILYTVVGSYGNAAMVTTNHRFCFQRHIALIQLDKEKAVPKFIELVLSSDQTKKSVDQVVAGNAQPTLTLGELRKLQIPLPHPETQRKICEVIYPVEQQCSALENKINAMHNLKQAVASDLLSGRKPVTL